MDTDRNLLFGALTVNADLVDDGQLTQACTAWAAGEAETLADVMVDRGFITQGDRAEVERMLDRKLKKHGGDVAGTLAATIDGPTRQALTQVADEAIQKTMSMAPDRAGHVVLSAISVNPTTTERYTRTRLHATGGIGRVWLARDASFGREVALKEIRPEREGNDVVWSRFLEEARITGQLEHPGIVPVYELGAGGDGAHPFYTMRFVKGRTLTEASHDYHKARVEGKATPLDQAALLNAFVGVCNALAYAHSRGVIHRDLKGQNVVLGDYGEVIVLDWGLAKLVDTPDAEGVDLATLPDDGHHARFQTLAGRALGTPAYMPPEQASGRLDVVDRLSDVYGLGAILYEIITGRPPYDGTKTADILRKVIEEAPPRPRAVVPGTSPALEAVCLKAMAKKQTGRYASAAALADDVRRYLADEPVAAYPEPLLVRAGRWAKKHRTPVAAAAALLVTATIALSVSTVLIRRERNEARFQRNEARVQRGQARNAVDDMYTEVAEKWLEDRLDPVQKQFLEKALAYYETFAGQDGADMPVRLERGRAYQRMGDILLKLGRRDEADKAYRKASGLIGAVAADFPGESEPKHHLANAKASLGVLLSDRGDFAGAKTLFEDARSIQNPLVAAGQATPQDRLFLARADRGLAEVHRKRGENSEAVLLFQAACSVLEPASDFKDEFLPARKVTADARDRLGLIYKETGKLDLAAESFNVEAGVMQAVVDEFPTIPGPRQALVNAMRSLGLVQQKLEGQGEAALASLRRAAESADRLTKDFPLRPEYRRDAAKCHNNLGQILFFHGHLPAAEPHYRDAVAHYERLIAEVPDVLQYRHDLARTCNNLGLVLRAVGKPEEAGRFCERTVEIYSDLAARAPDVPEYRQALAQAQMNLGVMLEAVAQLDRAEDVFLRSQAGNERLVAQFPDVPGHRADLAKTLMGRASWRLKNAKQWDVRASRAADAAPVLAGRAERTAWAVGQVADRLGAAIRRREAEALYRRVVAIDEELVATFPKLPEHRASLAMALINMAQTGTPEAEAINRRALAAFEALAVDQPEVVSHSAMIGVVAGNLGEIEQAAGRWDKAEKLYLRSTAALEPLVEKSPTDLDFKFYLGRTLADRGELRLAQNSASDAKSLLDRGVALQRIAFKANPKDGERRLYLYGATESLARTNLALGAHAEAARLAAELIPLAEGPTRGGLDALSLLARCAAKAESDPALPMDRRHEAARDYVSRAVGLIRGAMTASEPVVGRFEAGPSPWCPGTMVAGVSFTAAGERPSREVE
ncbi:MAG TPA: protein kinase [Isosphaeraceae bacterium]